MKGKMVIHLGKKIEYFMPIKLAAFSETALKALLSNKRVINWTILKCRN